MGWWKKASPYGGKQEWGGSSETHLPKRFPVSERESPKLKMEVKHPKTGGGAKVSNGRTSIMNNRFSDKTGEELEEPMDHSKL